VLSAFFGFGVLCRIDYTRYLIAFEFCRLR
jgi:hypothetical protein